MRAYPKNSPEALARVIAMAMITDGELDNHELETLDRYEIHRAVGLSRDDFVQVVLDYCRDLLSTARSHSINMLEAGRLNFVLDHVTDPGLRLIACSATLVLSKADGQLSTPEQSLLRHMLEHWGLSLDQISAQLREKRAGH
jgi:DnaJ-domain-containing protein 1